MLHLFRSAVLGGRSGVPWRIPACAIVFAAAAPALQAQTIVPNPHLNTTLTPWSAFASTAPDPVGAGQAPLWQSPPDVDGNAASGSARVRMTPSATNASSGISQCFDFSTPTSVLFLNYGMALRVPAVVALDGSMSANVEIRLYSGAGCSGFLGGGSQGQVLNNAMSGDTWYRIRDNNFVPNETSVATASVEVRGYLRQTGAAPTQSDYAINFDHFVLVLNSTTPVELIRFEVN